jgi:hypothetical protein
MLQSQVGDMALPPEDWIGIAKACLSPGDYLLWKTSYTELYVEQPAPNAAHSVQITSDMLLDKGPFESVNRQLRYPVQTYQQITIAIMCTWRESQKITKILQGPEEPF